MLFIKEKSGEYGFYGSLPELLKEYPKLNKDTVAYWLSRKKLPYTNEDLEIYRGDIKRTKQKNPKN